MKDYSSKIVNLKVTTEQAFGFLSDFRNFREVLPSEISNWEADAERCSFTAPMIGKVEFEYGEKQPFNLLSIVPSGNLPVSMSIHCKLMVTDEQQQGQVVVKAKVGALQEMLIGRIFQNIAEMMADRLSQLTADDIKN